MFIRLSFRMKLIHVSSYENIMRNKLPFVLFCFTVSVCIFFFFFFRHCIKKMRRNCTHYFSPFLQGRKLLCVLLVFLRIKLILKRVCSKRQEFAPRGSKFFPLREDPFSEGRHKHFDRVASSDNVTNSFNKINPLLSLVSKHILKWHISAI